LTDTIVPVYRVPMTADPRGPAPDRPEPVVSGANGAVRALVSTVDLITRYSNNSAFLDDLRYARQAAMAPGGDDESDLGGEHRARAKSRWAVAERLTADELRTMVECYRAGMVVRDLAGTFSISPSSIKRILRQAGARKRRKPPG
jgi:hypothetical protein